MMDSTRCGVLLVNLGTPDAPTIPAVRRFLAEFLSDRRVIDYPRLLWLPVLYGIILRVRPPKTAHAYAQIWTKDGSPLLLRSQALAQSLRDSLGNKIPVALGMTYGSPSVASALQSLRDQRADRIVAIPLYPQYSYTTTGSARDRIDAELKRWSAPPPLSFIDHYHAEPRYLDALARSIRDHWAKNGRKHLLFSFHGIPQRYVNNGDPYFDHCTATARGTVDRLQLSPSEWTLAFQSRVTKDKWLEPYTDKTLLEYAKRGPKEVTVICPAFATDNLETLEEIAIRNRADFLNAGGTTLDYVPCLNETPAHVDLFKELVHRALSFSGQRPTPSGR
jgi:protoporphyrin/coproporphyrin ferrochelatase